MKNHDAYRTNETFIVMNQSKIEKVLCYRSTISWNLQQICDLLSGKIVSNGEKYSQMVENRV